jgi:hypothetical protein
MFNATEILINSFVQKLREGYHRTYGGLKTDYEDIIAWAGNMAMENIANSDALYHNVEHSIMVTLVGQEILRGKQIREGGVTLMTGCTLSLLWYAMTLAMSRECVAATGKVKDCMQRVKMGDGSSTARSFGCVTDSLSCRSGKIIY